jgi:hypothetical protein
MSHERLKGILKEDAASKYLEGLSDAERRPQYITNGLPPSPKSFTEEERKAAFAIFTPKDKDNKKSG